MKKILLCLLAIAMLSSCGIMNEVMKKRQSGPQTYTLPLVMNEMPASDIYIDLDYGIRLNVVDKRAQQSVLNRYETNSFNGQRPEMSTYPDVLSFVSESMKKYMETMGFDLNADINTDYLLQVEITEYHLSYLSGMGWMSTVCFDLQVYDENRKLVYPRTTVTGRSSVTASPDNDVASAAKSLNDSYVTALKSIDWDRIAYFLKRADSPSQEKNKQVSGSGDTALEHMVIRWYVDSAPKGADVFWRVVSSTPDVKNTNQSYLGTTPYESTETFDIKGLTFNNSGDVQIEISCEKAGYAVQKKRFNLRQAIEQKEISTKFNLVEE